MMVRWVVKSSFWGIENIRSSKKRIKEKIEIDRKSECEKSIKRQDIEKRQRLSCKEREWKRERWTEWQRIKEGRVRRERKDEERRRKREKLFKYFFLIKTRFSFCMDATGPNKRCLEVLAFAFLDRSTRLLRARWRPTLFPTGYTHSSHLNSGRRRLRK